MPPLMPLPFERLKRRFDRWAHGPKLEATELQYRAATPTGFVGLRRFFTERSGAPVLLVHGASAGSRTFLAPKGGLVKRLLNENWDVWTLDWRSSNLYGELNRPPRRPKTQAEANTLLESQSLDAAVKQDLVPVIEALSKHYGLKLRMVAHCIGGAVASQAIAQFPQITNHLSHVVITTLGLFFRVAADDWFKGNDRMLLRIDPQKDFPQGNKRLAISPWAASRRAEHAWPAALEDNYALWKDTFLPHGCLSEFCNRSAFMYGLPYKADIIAAMHGPLDQPDSPPANIHKARGLWAQFGDMPLGAYQHCTQNLRRGFAGPFGAGHNTTYLNAEPFSKLDRLTLLTGRENQVWNRDSIDFMYEWLLQAHEDPAIRARFVRRVESGFGHQDLYWVDDAAQRKYIQDIILAGLGGSQAAEPLSLDHGSEKSGAKTAGLA